MKSMIIGSVATLKTFSNFGKLECLYSKIIADVSGNMLDKLKVCYFSVCHGN